MVQDLWVKALVQVGELDVAAAGDEWAAHDLALVQAVIVYVRHAEQLLYINREYPVIKLVVLNAAQQ